MVKKLTVFTMALSAVAAFALPAAASAAPSLTMGAGTLVPAGTQITGDSTNTETTTPLGTLKCGTVTVNATVTQNTGTAIMANATAGASTSSTCTLGANSVNITNITLTTLTATSSTKNAQLTFIADLPGGLECHFESAPGGTPVSWTTGSSTLHLQGQLVGNPSICGEEGEVEIHGDFSLSTTSGGGAVILD